MSNNNINIVLKNTIKNYLDTITFQPISISEPTFSIQFYITPSSNEIITYECITSSSIVNFVNSNGNKYVFNNATNYNPYIKYGLNNGYYEFTNISASHPISFTKYWQNKSYYIYIFIFF